MLQIRSVSHDYDAAISGAGPAGAAFALRLVRQGWRVALIDQQEFPRDKVCGDFVGPAGLAEIADLGLADRIDYRRANRVTCASLFLDGRELITRDMPRIGNLADHGRVIPRLDFDNWLWQAAVDAGARPVQARVTGFEQSADGVTVQLKGRDPIRARLLVGADGSASTVSRALQGNTIDKIDRIIAVRAYFDGVAGDEDRCDLFFSSESFPGYYWLFPTGGGRANVGVGMVLDTLPPTEAKLSLLLESLIEKDPALRARLGGARIDGRIVGWPLTTYNARRRVIGDRLLLLGDAAGLINPLNGEGIQYALESARWGAEVAAACLAGDRLDRQALEPYAVQVRERMDYDMALAGLIIQIIRNRGLNPIWLKALEIITQRARHDDAYAEIAGGVLAGLTPARNVINTTMILGSLRQAAVSLTAGTLFGAVRHQDGVGGFFAELAAIGLQMARGSASEPRATAAWALGVGLRSGRLAQHVALDVGRSAVRAVSVERVTDPARS
jgi:geranylgeranyl reductase family protein